MNERWQPSETPNGRRLSWGKLSRLWSACAEIGMRGHRVSGRRKGPYGLLRLASQPLHEFGEQRLAVAGFRRQEMIGAHPGGAQNEQAVLAVLGGIDPGA